MEQEIGDQHVLEALERVLSDSDFLSSQRSTRFLRFVVDRVLGGEPESISQHSIARTAFDRGNDFDPTSDPIVRIQAGRLRRSLEHYYLTAGAHDAVRIELPKGSYVPTFRSEAADAGSGVDVERNGHPILAVVPLENLTGRSEWDYVASGMTEEFCISLARYEDFHILPLVSVTSVAPEARFRLDGKVYRVAPLGLSIRLTDTRTGLLVYADRFGQESSNKSAFDAPRHIADRVAATLADQSGRINQTLAADTSRDSAPSRLEHDAFLRFYDFERDHSAETLEVALVALESAVAHNARSYRARAMLARLYGSAYSFGRGVHGKSLDETLELAHAHAACAIQENPLSEHARLVAAFLHLVEGDLDAGRREADHAASLGAGTLYLQDLLGYVLILLGDWGRGVELALRAIEANPCHRSFTHLGLWLDAVRRHDGEEAFEQALECREAGDFWSPLARATALVMMDRIGEAERQGQLLLERRPDFPERGRWLITRYVKDWDLVEALVQALAKAGVPCC